MNEKYLDSLPKELFKELAHHNLLSALVRSQVIGEAVKTITVDKSSIDEALRQFKIRSGIRDELHLQDYLRGCGLKVEDLEWQVSLPLRIREYCKKNFSQKAKHLFLTRKPELDQVIYRLIRVHDQYLARELYLRINGEEYEF